MARRHQPIPMLDGVPSPGLRRMRRMNADQLHAQLGRLELEARRITERLQRLEGRGGDEPTRPAREARMQRAADQRRRLVRLIEEGRQLLREHGG